MVILNQAKPKQEVYKTLLFLSVIVCYLLAKVYIVLVGRKAKKEIKEEGLIRKCSNLYIRVSFKALNM